MVEISDVKEYLRVDTDSDDEQIASLMSAAKEYLKNAGITENYAKESKLYNLAVCMLVVNWYDNRCPVGQANEKMKFSLNAIMQQLKWVDLDE